MGSRSSDNVLTNFIDYYADLGVSDAQLLAQCDHGIECLDGEVHPAVGVAEVW